MLKATEGKFAVDSMASSRGHARALGPAIFVLAQSGQSFEFG